MTLAWLGLAQWGLALAGSRPKARPCTSLITAVLQLPCLMHQYATNLWMTIPRKKMFKGEIHGFRTTYVQSVFVVVDVSTFEVIDRYTTYYDEFGQELATFIDEFQSISMYCWNIARLDSQTCSLIIISIIFAMAARRWESYSQDLHPTLRNGSKANVVCDLETDEALMFLDINAMPESEE
ncbi:hypothetical protein F4604DRAFT_1676699 [Suillus subluteus]|nr:hypothetical protein F4604DRAFT_1676699 [Suillus subluteus]